MTVEEYIKQMNGDIDVGERTCDTVKCGDVTRECNKVAVTMMGTAETITKAREWGADLLIVHEPVTYDHMDGHEHDDDPVISLKRKLMEDSGMVIYRYHDHAHAGCRELDLITQGECTALGLKGKIEKTQFGASYILTLDKPMTPRKIWERTRDWTWLHHVRAVGSIDKPVTRIAACFGTPGGLRELLAREDVELMMTGEICEWALAEYVRDAAYFGKNKSLLVMTHVGSERGGMVLLQERLSVMFPEVITKYFECDEVYLYDPNDIRHI